MEIFYSRCYLIMLYISEMYERNLSPLLFVLCFTVLYISVLIY